ncbi:hypothetical protein [Paraburkholderia sp. HD33-4]|uniref:hypothetical protein n=1 Tax=Paraburkholderia sp. HD33-4 TaxID=2883242 RepID=UPI001F269438|nr:hypothetical protein [Paraburkholderia sp. HD33-4]
MAQAILLALPWILFKPRGEQCHHVWRAAAAAIVTTVPPLGIIGWVSPSMSQAPSFLAGNWPG